MSSIALARQAEIPPVSRSHSRRSFKAATARASRPWIEVAIANVERHIVPRSAPPAYVWLITALIVIAHVSVVWYAKHHISNAKPRRAELALEFVAPPKPLQPKVEPPKPQPPKPQPKQAQVLPPIQTAAPEPSNVSAVSSEPPVAVAPIVTEAPPAPEPVIAAFGRAGYLNNPPPDYPAAASRAGWQGTVTLLVRVLANGKVEKVEVQKSSGHKALDDEAARTVKNWTFSPSKRGTTPIDGWATVPIEFKLDS